MLNFYNEKATIRNRRCPSFFSRKYGVNFVRACPVKECVGLTHFQTKEIIIIYSASNLERPLLWFVANGYVFCCQMINVTAARLKLGRDVPPPFFSICESLEVILQFDIKVTTAFITGGESWLVANCFKPGIEY